MRPIDADVLLEKLQRMIDYCKNDNQVNGLTALFQVGDAIMDCPTLTPPNEPLTLEELRQMDGQPVWVEDVKHWALIDIEKGGQWDGMPFATWNENGVRFCYNVINRNLLCYRLPPEGLEDTKD